MAQRLAYNIQDKFEEVMKLWAPYLYRNEARRKGKNDDPLQAMYNRDFSVCMFLLGLHMK